MSATVTPSELERAIASLRRGEPIGLPTETVYGLAADATNPAAVRRIFALKGRPAEHPLIVHVEGAQALAAWARHVPDVAVRLADRFWPGPLTLILPKRDEVPAVVTGGQETVALRCPAHPVALAVLRAFGRGLAAPSANRFGHVSPTTARHVREEFGDAVPVVLDGGECGVGIESTIVDLSGLRPRLLRPGMISLTAIEAVAGPLDAGPVATSPRTPGMLEKHYAPRTPALLLDRAAAIATARERTAGGAQVLVLALGTLDRGLDGLALPADPVAYARGLYAALRELDARHGTLLVLERPPDTPAWLALHDRLRRATAGAGAFDDSP